jgi:hypothetical protein
MLKIRTVLLSVVLALALMFTVQLVTAGTDVVSESAGSPAVLPNIQGRSINEDDWASGFTYRSPSDECFDVALWEAASCRAASQAPIPLHQSPLDECYDVPLRELASCRSEGKTTSP